MSERIHSIDTLRAVAMFFIVLGHVQPFRGLGTYGNYVYFALDTVGQFDVPFFFVTSGYFLAMTADADTVAATVGRVARKLGSIYLFGRLVSVTAATGLAVVLGVSVTTVLARLGDLSAIDVLYYGNALAVPLWFLTALFFAIVLVSCFVWLGKTRYLLPVAALVHVVGIVGTNYGMLVDVPFPTRDALFFGFFYVALGHRIGSTDWTPDPERSRLYLGAACSLLGLQFVEQYAIGYVLRDNVLAHEVYMTEYTASTALLVPAVFVYALSNPQWGRETILPKVGRHALGIYLIHVPVTRALRATTDLLAPAIGVDLASTLPWQLIAAPLVYVLSLAVYLLLARMGVVELGGSHTPWLRRLRSRVGSSTRE